MNFHSEVSLKGGLYLDKLDLLLNIIYCIYMNYNHREENT